MFLIRFVKNWTLPLAMLAGITLYFLFARVACLSPLKPYVARTSHFLTPVLIFCMLFFTFCKIDPRSLRPRLWHGWLLLLQAAACIGMVGYMVWARPEAGPWIVCEGVLACLLCPTATAAAVVTGKLGGNAASLTTYTLESNLLSALLITLLCPLVHPKAGVDVLSAFGVILHKVSLLLICPFLAACVVRYLFPRFHRWCISLKDIAFYLWGVSLTIVMGQTAQTVMQNAGYARLEWQIALGALVVCCLKFWLGKNIGGRYDERISGGQALGQKNTVFAIWMAISYLTPIAAVAPGSYVVWQNTINSWQLWRKRKQDAR